MCIFSSAQASKACASFKRPLIVRNTVFETVGDLNYEQSLEEIDYENLNQLLAMMPCRELTMDEVKELNSKINSAWMEQQYKTFY